MGFVYKSEWFLFYTIRNMTTTPPIKPIVRPPYLYSGFLLAGLLIHLAVPFKIFSHARTGSLIGILFMVAGISLVISAVRTLKKEQVSPRFKPVSIIVTSGPFGYTRNPMYLAFTLIYISVAFVINAFWPILLLPVLLCVMHYGVIRREETYLGKLFDDEYKNYCLRVRRWF